MRLLGVGREGINIFCSMMDICQGISIGIYYSCLENVYTAAFAVYDLIISKGIDEEKNLISASDPNANSTNFTAVISGKIKKYSDIETYNDWYEDHKEFCTINHKGSAGKMEVDAIIAMFSRSVQKHQVKYVKYTHRHN
ncbi:unnamed protein product [Euphydryas editha]|nr:unnamed protein product [Euphydryas editha]